MTELISVPTVFGHTVEVDEGEAAALERAGLVRHADTTPAEAPERVTVTPTFTGQPMQVPPDEAESLDREGLLIHDEPVPPQRQDEHHETDDTSAEQEK